MDFIGIVQVITLVASGVAAFAAITTRLAVTQLELRIVKLIEERLEKCQKIFVDRRECEPLKELQDSASVIAQRGR